MTEGGSRTVLEPTKTVIYDNEKGESTQEYPGAKQDEDREETWNKVEHNCEKNNNKPTNMEMDTKYCQTVTEEDMIYTAMWIFDNIRKATETEIREKLKNQEQKLYQRNILKREEWQSIQKVKTQQQM